MSESVFCPGRNFINALHSETDASKTWDIYPQTLQALLPTPAAAWDSWCVIFMLLSLLGAGDLGGFLGGRTGGWHILL